MIVVNDIEVSLGEHTELTVSELLVYLKEIGFADAALDDPMLTLNNTFIPDNNYKTRIVIPGDNIFLISQSIGG